MARMQSTVELIGFVALIALIVYAAASGTLSESPRYVIQVKAMMVITIPIIAGFMLYDAYTGVLDAQLFYAYLAIAVGLTLIGVALYVFTIRKK